MTTGSAGGHESASAIPKFTSNTTPIHMECNFYGVFSSVGVTDVRLILICMSARP